MLQMKRLTKIIVLFLCVISLGQTLAVFAFETDQYHLPPVPLGDIGDEVNEYARQNIGKALEKLNRQIVERQNCPDGSNGRENCDSAEKNVRELARLRSVETVAHEVFKRLGDGIPPFTNSGTWMEKHEFKASPARYKTSFADSIFGRYPVNYLTISETVKIYGAEFGTDKVAHLFQQGYSYYRIVRDARAKGLPATEAVKKALRFGRRTERTIYGTLVSGVFSNADLCANYTGMRFYENLTAEITLDGVVHPPIVVLKDGVWAFNDANNLRENLLKPFLDEHLNEALNPSVYTNFVGFRSAVRGIVKNRACPEWRRRFPDLTAEDYRRETDSLKLWNGEDYGYQDSRNFITIADSCF